MNQWHLSMVFAGWTGNSDLLANTLKRVTRTVSLVSRMFCEALRGSDYQQVYAKTDKDKGVETYCDPKRRVLRLTPRIANISCLRGITGVVHSRVKASKIVAQWMRIRPEFVIGHIHGRRGLE